jgi:hypothetical protein
MEPFAANDNLPSFEPTVFEWEDPTKLPVRDWIYGKHLIRRHVSATIASGAVGKSQEIATETPSASVSLSGTARTILDRSPRPPSVRDRPDTCRPVSAPALSTSPTTSCSKVRRTLGREWLLRSRAAAVQLKRTTGRRTQNYQMYRSAEVSKVEFNVVSEMHFLCLAGHDRDRRSPMTKLTTLSAIAIIVAAIAAPVFAQDAIGPGYGLKSQPGTKHRSNYRGPHNQSFRGSYNRSNASFYTRPLTNRERLNIENFGWSGRDPSRVGGEDPYLRD